MEVYDMICVRNDPERLEELLLRSSEADVKLTERVAARLVQHTCG